VTTHALLRAQILEVWGAGRVDLIDTNYAENVVDHMPITDQLTGRAAMKDVVRHFRAALHDMKMELHGTLACGDLGVDWWTLTGTHTGALGDLAPTNRAVEFSGIDMVRVAGGRITDVWHVEEMLRFGAQLGAPPMPVGEALPAPPPAEDPGAGAAIPDPALLSLTESRNLALARRHLEQFWALGRIDLAPEIFAPDVIDLNPMEGQRPGIDGLVDLVGWLRDAAPDLAMRVECYVPQGEYVGDRWTLHGTHTGAPLLGLPAKGRAFAFGGMDVVHFRDDGLIDRVFHVEEFTRLRAAIG